jgi:hypothetical protein
MSQPSTPPQTRGNTILLVDSTRPVKQSHGGAYDQLGLKERWGLEVLCMETTPPAFINSVLPAVSSVILHKTETALRENGLLLDSCLGWAAFQNPPEAREGKESAVFDSAVEAIVTTILSAAGAKPGLAVFCNIDCVHDSEIAGLSTGDATPNKSGMQTHTGDVVLRMQFKKRDTPVECFLPHHMFLAYHTDLWLGRRLGGE